MTERKNMKVLIRINDPEQAWIVGRVSGMIESIANGGASFLEGYGYAVARERIYNNTDGKFYDQWTLSADVSGEEFDKIFTMLDRGYGDKKLFDYTVECDW